MGERKETSGKRKMKLELSNLSRSCHGSQRNRLNQKSTLRFSAPMAEASVCWEPVSRKYRLKVH